MRQNLGDEVKQFLDVTLVRDDQRQFEAHKTGLMMNLVAALMVTICPEAGKLDQAMACSGW